jgi:hypothetical protein
MELSEFLQETQTSVREQMAEGSPFAEIVFSEIVMKHMVDIGMTSDPIACNYKSKVGNAILRLSGYSISEDQDHLDLFVSLYDGVDTVTSISDTDTKIAVEQCLRFLSLCAEGKLAPRLEPAHEVKSLAETLQQIYVGLEQVRVYVLTDRVAKSKSFRTREIGGKSVRLEVMDIERLHRHWSEGKPRDELVANFIDLSGGPLPCVHVPDEGGDYEYALTAIPGEALRLLYERFGARLLEANVRSFLNARKDSVNAGIQKTLREAPGRFIAYNNGIVIVADEMQTALRDDGLIGITRLTGMQIVNGGQTTASIYFTRSKYKNTDLSRVRVPAKVIVMKAEDPADEEALISDISRFANSQNAVKQSDLSANKPFHVAIEKHSLSVYCPDGVGRWFYERAAGSYTTLLKREGTTPAKLKVLKEAIPLNRRLTKTDLAKYVTAWDKQPDIVSKGSQKNFDHFMTTLSAPDGTERPMPKVSDYKAMIAKALIFRATQKQTRTSFLAFQANVAAYTVSVLADRLGSRIDLDRIWAMQKPSPQLMAQIEVWATEVNDALTRTANGRMISEWAKKPECRDAVLGATYSPASSAIPEIR